MPSLEEVITANTSAVNENTNAVKALMAGMAAKGGSAPVTAAAVPADGAKRGPGRPKKVTLDEVKAIAEKVRDTKGTPAAVELIRKHGAEKLIELSESKYPQFVAACEVVLNEEEAGEEVETDDSL